MKQGRGERVRVGSKEHGEAVAPGWVVLEGQQEDPGSAEWSFNAVGAGLALSP